MNKETRYFLCFIVLIIAIVVIYRYQQYVINKNFILNVNTTCDINTEKCFISDCSLDDPDCDVTPYKKVSIIDIYAPKCLEEHDCLSFFCENIKECSITYCSLDKLDNGERCIEYE